MLVEQNKRFEDISWGFLGIVMGNFHDFMTFYGRLIDQLKKKLTY